ncbi:MAG: hypothetical protein JRI25_22805 [Deltaproteobacteria bacterium]|nr:hypothetical protein [Deltaproteobacteria bacterium]
MFRRPHRRPGWFRGLLLAASLLVPGVAWALSLTVAPGTVDVVVPAGSSEQVYIDVGNGGQTPLEVRAYLFDWWHEAGQQQFPPPGTVERSAALWSSVVPARLTLDAKSRDRLILVVAPPADAIGGFFAVVFVDAAAVPNPEAAPATTLGLSARVGVLVAVRVQGTGNDALVVAGVEVRPPTESTPLEVSAQVRNTGDVHLKPETRVVVLDGDEQVRAKLAERHPIVLPGQDASLESQWGGELEPGAYTALVTVVFGEGQATTVEHVFAVGTP